MVPRIFCYIVQTDLVRELTQITTILSVLRSKTKDLFFNGLFLNCLLRLTSVNPYTRFLCFQFSQHTLSVCTEALPSGMRMMLVIWWVIPPSLQCIRLLVITRSPQLQVQALQPHRNPNTLTVNFLFGDFSLKYKIPSLLFLFAFVSNYCFFSWNYDGSISIWHNEDEFYFIYSEILVVAIV